MNNLFVIRGAGPLDLDGRRRHASDRGRLERSRCARHASSSRPPRRRAPVAVALALVLGACATAPRPAPRAPLSRADLETRAKAPVPTAEAVRDLAWADLFDGQSAVAHAG